MSGDSTRSNLRHALLAIPNEVLPDATRSRVAKLFDQLDQMLFLDATHELAVDRSTFIKLVTNEEFVPKELRDITLVETSKYLGRRIKERGNGRRILWHEGEKYGLPSHGLTDEDIRRLGVTARTSESEMTAILKTLVPDIPPFWKNDNPKQLAEAIVAKFHVNRSVWDCLVAHLGWWAALTLAGGLVVFLILLGSGVPWYWALLIAGIYQTGATLYFLLQCAANPNFQQ